MKKLSIILMLAMSAIACQNNTANVQNTEGEKQETSNDKDKHSSAKKEILEGYKAISYPLTIEGTAGPSKSQKMLESKGFEVLSMGNPGAKKGMLITNEGVRLSIEAAESMQMGNYSLTFKVVDDHDSAIGDEEMVYFFSAMDGGYMNTTVAIKDNQIELETKEYKDGNATPVKTDKTILKISKDGVSK